MNRLFNINAIAETLSLSPWTVRALIRNGRLNPTRIGRRVLVGESELSRFITECQQESKPAPIRPDCRPMGREV